MLTHHQSARRRVPSLADRTDGASEQSLAAYWTAYVDAGRGGAPFILRNWPSSWAAVRAVRRLPVVEARPVGHSRWPGGTPGPGHPGVVRRARAAARHRDPRGARGRRRLPPRPARPDAAPQDPLGGAARAQGPPDRRRRRAAGPGRRRQPRGAAPRRPVVPRADAEQRRPARPRPLADRRRPRRPAAAARGGAVRRRVRDAALLPHPRGRATRTATRATSRAARWSPSWRGAACATCSTPRRRPSRPTGCGTSSGWWGSGTRGCGCGRSYCVDANPVDDQLLREGQAVGHLAAEHAADREVEDQVERPVEGPVALRLDLVAGDGAVLLAVEVPADSSRRPTPPRRCACRR